MEVINKKKMFSCLSVISHAYAHTYILYTRTLCTAALPEARHRISYIHSHLMPNLAADMHPHTTRSPRSRHSRRRRQGERVMIGRC